MMSGDGYLFVRDIYLQTREYEIKDGNLDDAFDDFGDYEDFEEYDDYY
jgi:phospholipid-binding lipoprotein MlaA